MPTYSYRCTECDNAFDIQQAFTDSSLTVCPVCGGKLRKVFGIVGVTFNGPGFYRTDSRSKSDTKHTKTHAKVDTATSPVAVSSPSTSGGSDSGSMATSASGSKAPASKTSSSKAGSTTTK